MLGGGQQIVTRRHPGQEQRDIPGIRANRALRSAGSEPQVHQVRIGRPVTLVTAADDRPMSLTTDVDTERTETLPGRVVNHDRHRRDLHRQRSPARTENDMPIQAPTLSSATAPHDQGRREKRRPPV